jgi:hypothetical protein
MRRIWILSSARVCFGAVAALGWIHCGDGRDSTSCEEIVERTSAAVDAAEAKADRSCTQDSDCALRDYGIRCVQTCGGAYAAGINQSAAAALDTEVSSIEEAHCAQFDVQHCTPMIVDCAPPVGKLATACRQNECVLAVVSVP